MCGLTGIVLGKTPRHEDDYEWLKESFTASLVANQARGIHATGIALIRRDGTYRLLKRPMPAEEFVEIEEYQDLMAELGSEVSILMGHTRFRTIGSEKKSNNNHPIRAGRIIGTHNGTIYNAAEIAKANGLSRYADVDSEVLFRMANLYRAPAQYKARLKQFQGKLTAVMVNLNRPERIRIYKGNKPLSVRVVDDLDALIYISEKSHFGSIDFDGIHYMEYSYKQNRVITIDVGKALEQSVSNFTFQAVRRKICTASLSMAH